MKDKKLFSLKETRLYVALAMLVQSFTFFIMFIILCVKKKSIAAAFLAVSAMEGGTAAYLLYQLKEETCAELDTIQAGLEDSEDIEFDADKIAADLAHGQDDEEHTAPAAAVPTEEQVSEDEFN